MATPGHGETVFRPSTSESRKRTDAAYAVYDNKMRRIEQMTQAGVLDDAEDRWLSGAYLKVLETVILLDQLTSAGVAYADTSAQQ
jgi:hypothetical protein